MVPSGEFVVAYRADKQLLRNNIIHMFLDRIRLRAIVFRITISNGRFILQVVCAIDYVIRLYCIVSRWQRVMLDVSRIMYRS